MNADLVKRAREWPPTIEMTADGWNELVDTGAALMAELAAALEAQAAELAMWREVKHSSPRLEIIEAELTAERAAHAEVWRDEIRGTYGSAVGSSCPAGNCQLCGAEGVGRN